jgi:hypothetical protein
MKIFRNLLFILLFSVLLVPQYFHIQAQTPAPTTTTSTPDAPLDESNVILPNCKLSLLTSTTNGIVTPASKQNYINNCIQNIFQFLLTLASISVILKIAYDGIMMLTPESKQSTSTKTTVTNLVIGLLLIIVGWNLLPILNFSFNNANFLNLAPIDGCKIANGCETEDQKKARQAKESAGKRPEPKQDSNCTKSNTYIRINMTSKKLYICRNNLLFESLDVVGFGPKNSKENSTPVNDDTGFPILTAGIDVYVKLAGGGTNEVYNRIVKEKRAPNPLIVEKGVYPEYEVNKIINSDKVGTFYDHPTLGKTKVEPILSNIYQQNGYEGLNLAIEFYKKTVGDASSCAIHDDIDGNSITSCCPTISQSDAVKLKSYFSSNELKKGDKVYIKQ